jgi:hypothetical protein
MMIKTTSIAIALFSTSLMADVTLAEYHSPTGDTLMIHRLQNQEIWGSFLITDQIADSFSSYELMVMQVDQYQPIQLDYQKVCGGAGRSQPTLMYDFEQSADKTWLFHTQQPVTEDSSLLNQLLIQAQPYQHMRSDRRPEVVDFAIRGELAVEGLHHQFKQGQELVFRYITEAGEQREARFHLPSQSW